MRVIVVLLSAFLSVSALAQVTFNIHGQIYEFEQPVRLATVLSIVKDKPTYWANAAVYALNDPHVEELRRDVLSQLASMIRAYNKGSNEYNNLTALYHNVGNWRLMRRLKVEVDYEQARLNFKKNPQFNQGDYYLRLASRSDSIAIVDLAKDNTVVPFHHAFSLVDYLREVSLPSHADRDYVYVIEPSGQMRKVGIAYWNREFFKPMPGSQLFIPMQTSLFSTRIETLNDSLARLMIHRM